MDWQTKMNKAVSYIEENLTGEIKSEVIAKMIGYSAWEFQRMFSFVTDTSLGEYIRSRRLAIAAYDIQTSDKKIIDIALKYGYDSSAAFSRAFSRQFGISPSSARNEGVKLEPYPKITFPTKKEGGIIMSIEKTFDNLSDEIIKPGDVYDRIEDEIENLPEVALVTFKSEFIDVIKSRPDMEIVTDKLAINDCDNNVYSITHKNKRIAVYQTLVGGAATVCRLENMIAWGVKKFVLFGGCGTLDKDIADDNFIVPTAAYRDEGTSYHYAEASDYIEIKTADKLSDIMTELKLPYIKGKTWTTDGFFRETKNNMLKRKAEGCLTVEMECASIMAAGQFRGVDVYQYLYTQDNLDATEWEMRSLGDGEAALSVNEKYMRIALDIAAMV